MWSGGIIIMASVVVSSSLLKSFKRKNKKSSKLNIFNKVIKYNMVRSITNLYPRIPGSCLLPENVRKLVFLAETLP